MSSSDITSLDRVYGGVKLDDERIVPFDRIVGVKELADLLTDHLSEMTNLSLTGVPAITRGQVSTWAQRHRTTRLPPPLPVRLSRGLLWDRDDFLDPVTGKLIWTGPPGRWGDE